MATELQRRLNQLQKEKLELEIAMEQEQEFMVNRLGRQLVERKQGGAAGAGGGTSTGSLSADAAIRYSMLYTCLFLHTLRPATQPNSIIVQPARRGPQRAAAERTRRGAARGARETE